MKTFIDWQDAPKVKGMVLVGHSFNRLSGVGNFGQWVYVAANAKVVSFRLSNYFSPAGFNSKSRRFYRYGEKVAAR